MTFKNKPLGTVSPTAGIDWASIAKKVASELGCDWSVAYLYANPNPSQGLHPLAQKRVRFAYEKLGSGAALPVLSFFGTKEDAESIAATIVSNEFGATSPENEWVWVMDENDSPIKVAAHKMDRVAFAVNAYTATLNRIVSNTDIDDSEGNENEYDNEIDEEDEIMFDS